MYAFTADLQDYVRVQTSKNLKSTYSHRNACISEPFLLVLRAQKLGDSMVITQSKSPKYFATLSSLSAGP